MSSLEEFLASSPVLDLKPGPESTELIRGLSVRQNQRNPFLVVTLRYEAHPGKDPETEEGREWWLGAMQDMGCFQICRSCDKPWPVREFTCPDCGEDNELVLSNTWRREYEIDYQAQAGSYVFDSFSRARNTCEPFRIPASWRRYRSIDHGVRNPTCCLWIAVDPDRNVWVYAEHYEAERTIDYHSRMIHEIGAKTDYHALNLTAGDLRMMERPNWAPSDEFKLATARLYRTIGDPSMANRTQKDVKTVRQRYADHGVFISMANNAYSGLEVINAMFSAGELTIFNTCTNLIREVEGLVWAEHTDPSRNKRERPVDRNDHSTDALRYFINEFAPAGRESLPQRGGAISLDEMARRDREAFRERARRRQGRARDDILDV